MSQVKFTIVVPVYKIPYNLLRECLDSVVNQSYKNYEVLIVDDESPDDCGKICDEYADKYNNVRVIHQKNGGLSVVRNVGFEQAKGEWVCFADGDDWMEKDALKTGANLLETAPDDIDVFICDAYISTPIEEKNNFFLGKKTEGNVYFRGEEKEQLIDLFFPRHYVKHEIKTLCDIGSTWARFYRRDFIVENKLRNVPGLRRTQDNIFNLYVIDKARAICYNCKRIYHYRLREDSVSNKYDPKITVAYYQLYNEFYKFAVYRNTDDYRQRAYNKMISLATWIMMNNFANSKNKDSYSKRVHEMKSYFEKEPLRNAIVNYNPRCQKKSYQLLHFLLLRRWYWGALIMSVLHERIKRK